MPKFVGMIGFLKSDSESETRPSRYTPVMEERLYTGELLECSSRNQNSEKTVDNFTLNNDISIVADAYALNHFSSMKYVNFMGAYWKVISAKPTHPRIRISIGGVYNGPRVNSE